LTFFTCLVCYLTLKKWPVSWAQYIKLALYKFFLALNVPFCTVFLTLKIYRLRIVLSFSHLILQGLVFNLVLYLLLHINTILPSATVLSYCYAPTTVVHYSTQCHVYSYFCTLTAVVSMESSNSSHFFPDRPFLLLDTFSNAVSNPALSFTLSTLLYPSSIQ
jgi:hypothetical protein